MFPAFAGRQACSIFTKKCQQQNFFLPRTDVNTFGVIEITFERLLLELLDLRLFKSIRFFIFRAVGARGISFRLHGR